jgi:SAM-dependent methyltransferase
MPQFYPRDYGPHWRPAAPRSRGLLQRWLAALSGNCRKHLPVRGCGRLLDFGCGSGVFLQRMQESGWRATGVDIAATAVQRMHARGLRALVGTLPHPELEDASFEVVTMWEALEHVHNPLEVLRAAHRLLVPGGRLLVAAPNIDSLAYRWFGASWYGLDVPRHLTHFNPWTLSMMLNRAGFRTGRVRMLRHSSWLWQSARRALRDHDGGRWLARRWPARVAEWYAALRRRADGIMAVAVKPPATGAG